MNEQIISTLLAKVYEVAIETPLDTANKLSNRYNANIYLKREDLQPVHSFKIRGAYNKIAHLKDKQLKKGVITASAGNHAQGVALSAQKMGIHATIVMPVTTPPIKVDAVKMYGAKVILNGNSYSDAYQHSLHLARSLGATYIHPFDDPLVIAGQGTIGREIIEQLPDTTMIFVPVGGGGLIAGIAQFVKAIKPSIKIIGVEPDDSNAMTQSLAANKRVTLNHVGIFADGVAVKQVGKHTFSIIKNSVDEIITVNNDEICSAIKAIFEETRAIVEPAGALSLAGLNKYAQNNTIIDQNIVTICSGANMTFERLQFVAERTLIGSGKEALLAIELPEQPGALLTLCQDVIHGYNVTEFSYRRNNSTKATILVGIGLDDHHNLSTLKESLQRNDYSFYDLSADDTAKEHVRHMVGGSNALGLQEYIFEVNFPEKPGALISFLKTIGNSFNISLFHYRGQGADIGRVLIGFETENFTLLTSCLNKTDYDWNTVDSEAVNLYL
jgi:threonine dehydratase